MTHQHLYEFRIFATANTPLGGTRKVTPDDIVLFAVSKNDALERFAEKHLSSSFFNEEYKVWITDVVNKQRWFIRVEVVLRREFKFYPPEEQR
jgi:hypothetical protein